MGLDDGDGGVAVHVMRRARSVRKGKAGEVSEIVFGEHREHGGVFVVARDDGGREDAPRAVE